jgi:mono/diheme cytochrome c family protein
MLLATLTWMALMTACGDDMVDQPRGNPLRSSTFFEDGALARPLEEGVIPRGHLREDTAFYTGRQNGELVAEVPLAVDAELLERGQRYYSIHCTPCHNQSGDGQGMIVLRGFTAPPSLHETRLRNAPDGYIFDVITHGYGRMFPYGDRVEPRDRWAIVAYIRALQLSQSVPIDALSPEVRRELEAQP